MAVVSYVRFPLSLRYAEERLRERRIDTSHEKILFLWNRFDPLFAVEIPRKRVEQICVHLNMQWHLKEMFVKINGETHYL